MTGFATALLAVAIYAAYPVATRSALGSNVPPDVLLYLRYVVGAALFLPFLASRARHLPSAAWREGLWLALFQGIAMGTLVVAGLQYAPASHAAALGPGASPAWVVLLGFVAYQRVPCARHVSGAALVLVGIAILLAAGSTLSRATLAGDALFLGASALGAAYVLRLRESRLDPVTGATLVAIYSAAAALPWFLATGTASAALALPPSTFLWHFAWQGVLVGFVALLALNHAVSRLGGEATTSLFALVPVLTTILGRAVLGEVPSLAEALAVAVVSAGVALGAQPARTIAVARA